MEYNRIEFSTLCKMSSKQQEFVRRCRLDKFTLEDASKIIEADITKLLNALVGFKVLTRHFARDNVYYRFTERGNNIRTNIRKSMPVKDAAPPLNSNARVSDELTYRR